MADSTPTRMTAKDVPLHGLHALLQGEIQSLELLAEVMAARKKPVSMTRARSDAAYLAARLGEIRVAVSRLDVPRTWPLLETAVSLSGAGFLSFAVDSSWHDESDVHKLMAHLQGFAGSILRVAVDRGGDADNEPDGTHSRCIAAANWLMCFAEGLGDVVARIPARNAEDASHD